MLQERRTQSGTRSLNFRSKIDLKASKLGAFFCTFILMKITVEISNYPLTEDYEPQIVDFIDRCIATGMKVKVNATSTHLQGHYDEVMDTLQKEIKISYERYGQMIFVVKILKGELNLEYQHEEM